MTPRSLETGTRVTLLEWFFGMGHVIPDVGIVRNPSGTSVVLMATFRSPGALPYVSRGPGTLPDMLWA
ncbi:hypothetical protein Misp02_52750 [Microtetraspora sp. NBRC 16547]|nr:hypothetical protein Misp02_52750 [Microtetraspora sp. NBRC 16547]